MSSRLHFRTARFNAVVLGSLLIWPVLCLIWLRTTFDPTYPSDDSLLMIEYYDQIISKSSLWDGLNSVTGEYGSLLIFAPMFVLDVVGHLTFENLQTVAAAAFMAIGLVLYILMRSFAASQTISALAAVLFYFASVQLPFFIDYVAIQHSLTLMLSLVMLLTARVISTQDPRSAIGRIAWLGYALLAQFMWLARETMLISVGAVIVVLIWSSRSASKKKFILLYGPVCTGLILYSLARLGSLGDQLLSVADSLLPSTDWLERTVIPVGALVLFSLGMFISWLVVWTVVGGQQVLGPSRPVDDSRARELAPLASKVVAAVASLVAALLFPNVFLAFSLAFPGSPLGLSWADSRWPMVTGGTGAIVLLLALWGVLLLVARSTSLAILVSFLLLLSATILPHVIEIAVRVTDAPPDSAGENGYDFLARYGIYVVVPVVAMGALLASRAWRYLIETRFAAPSTTWASLGVLVVIQAMLLTLWWIYFPPSLAQTRLISSSFTAKTLDPRERGGADVREVCARSPVADWIRGDAVPVNPEGERPMISLESVLAKVRERPELINSFARHEIYGPGYVCDEVELSAENRRGSFAGGASIPQDFGRVGPGTQNSLDIWPDIYATQGAEQVLYFPSSSEGGQAGCPRATVGFNWEGVRVEFSGEDGTVTDAHVFPVVGAADAHLNVDESGVFTFSTLDYGSTWFPGNNLCLQVGGAAVVSLETQEVLVRVNPGY